MIIILMRKIKNRRKSVPVLLGRGWIDMGDEETIEVSFVCPRCKTATLECGAAELSSQKSDIIESGIMSIQFHLNCSACRLSLTLAKKVDLSQLDIDSYWDKEIAMDPSLKEYMIDNRGVEEPK
jgi:hypothetical protein